MVGEKESGEGARCYELSRTTNKFVGKVGMADFHSSRGRLAERLMAYMQCE